MCLFWPADVPHSYHHYYSNPSYHTLSQNRPPLPHLPNNHDRIIKVSVTSAASDAATSNRLCSQDGWVLIILITLLQNTNNQLFCSVKNMERERRDLFGVESNATLPADWKHHEPRKDSGASGCTFRVTYWTLLPCREDFDAEKVKWNERINVYKLIKLFGFLTTAA